ncbi:MAG: hypothetical protein AB1393_05705 [Candidatus Edwardsbacteria bacterium]
MYLGFRLRGGYTFIKSEGERKGFSGGIGFEYKSFQDYLIDYAYKPFGKIGETHLLSLGVRF